MAEWSIAAVLKTVVLRGTRGSNPCLSAINAENQQIAKQTPNFTHKNVKLGVFVLFKISYIVNHIKFLVSNKMDLVEKINNAFETNKANPLFAPLDDEVLGKRIEGGFCKFEDIEGHTYKCFVFDNGECFLIDVDEYVLYQNNTLPQDWFIHKYIERIVYDFKEKYLSSLLEKDKGGNEVEPYMFANENEIQLKGVIRLLPYRDVRIVYLTNILLPLELRNKGIGLKLIFDIFLICQKLGYKLRLTEMVESFYNRMVKRGAMIITPYDEVEITQETQLYRIQ